MPLLAASGYDSREEILLALAVLVEIGMIVEVVLSEIGEHPHIEMAAINPPKVKGMGRYLHHDVCRPRIHHLSEHFLDIVGFWSCQRGWDNSAAIPIVNCANHPAAKRSPFEDRLDQERGGGFSICAGHADEVHLKRGIPKEGGR